MSNSIFIKPNNIGDYIREAEGDCFHPMHYYTLGNEIKEKFFNSKLRELEENAVAIIDKIYSDYDSRCHNNEVFMNGMHSMRCEVKLAIKKILGDLIKEDAAK